MVFLTTQLFIILFLHQTTTNRHCLIASASCLSSCSYIKPQLGLLIQKDFAVVYHLVPTSNHNTASRYPISFIVVYHLVPTSNHNFLIITQRTVVVVYHLVPTSNHNSILARSTMLPLFIILFLHQTTTSGSSGISTSVLFIILFLHQTTTHYDLFTHVIKVVYHLVPTSNHNAVLLYRHDTALFIILFLHQTTTMPIYSEYRTSCLSSCSYIKPQRMDSTVFKPFGCLSSCSYIKPQPICKY